MKFPFQIKHIYRFVLVKISKVFLSSFLENVNFIYIPFFCTKVWISVEQQKKNHEINWL